MFYNDNSNIKDFKKYIFDNFKYETLGYLSIVLLFLSFYIFACLIGKYIFTFNIFYSLLIIFILPILSLITKFFLSMLFDWISNLFKEKIEPNFSNFFFGGLIILSIIIFLEIYFINDLYTYSIIVTPTLFFILIIPILNIFFGKTNTDRSDYVYKHVIVYLPFLLLLVFALFFFGKGYFLDSKIPLNNLNDEFINIKYEIYKFLPILLSFIFPIIGIFYSVILGGIVSKIYGENTPIDSKIKNDFWGTLLILLVVFIISFSIYIISKKIVSNTEGNIIEECFYNYEEYSNFDDVKKCYNANYSKLKLTK